jgi:hypothetical protein
MVKENRNVRAGLVVKTAGRMTISNTGRKTGHSMEYARWAGQLHLGTKALHDVPKLCGGHAKKRTGVVGISYSSKS